MHKKSEETPSDYLVTPEVGRGAGVLVLHSGRGLTEFINRLCVRLAREGFVALAPDVFEGRFPETKEEAQRVKTDIESDQLYKRLEDTVEFLRQHESVSQKKIGIIGIGYGAELACTLAPRIDTECDGIVLFYGYQRTDWQNVDTPILGHFAELDHEIPESMVNDIRTRLHAHAIPYDLFMYSYAEPSFFETDSTARHHPEAAQLAWERTISFLRRELTPHTMEDK